MMNHDGMTVMEGDTTAAGLGGGPTCHNHKLKCKVDGYPDVQTPKPHLTHVMCEQVGRAGLAF